MSNQKAIRFECDSKNTLEDILNKLISEGNTIIEVITTEIGGYGESDYLKERFKIF